MERLIVEIESAAKAKELMSLLAALNFVKKVSSVADTNSVVAALQEHEEVKASIVRRKNKAIAKYL